MTDSLGNKFDDEILNKSGKTIAYMEKLEKEKGSEYFQVVLAMLKIKEVADKAVQGGDKEKMEGTVKSLADLLYVAAKINGFEINDLMSDATGLLDVAREDMKNLTTDNFAHIKKDLGYDK